MTTSGDESGREPEVEPDEESDPSLDDDTGSDWVDEGGAIEQGPATETSASDDDSET